jgi:sugar lactone lactonase YvrE
VAWLPELRRLVVLSDAEDRLLLLDDEQRVVGEVPLFGRRQEGLAFDDDGRLWVADDRLGLLRFLGARQALERLLPAQPAAEAGP